MTIRWNEGNSVGIKVFDDHHRKLFEMLNSLMAAAEDCKNTSDTVARTLKDLLDYTVYHFREEEKAFDKYGYPDTAQQKKEHEYFTSKIRGYCATYFAGSEPLPMEIIDFLVDWLVNHIMDCDMKYSIFLREKGML